MKLIDLTCPKGHIHTDVFVDSLDALPTCVCLVMRGVVCGLQTERAWLTAPGITPRGTRPERRVEPAGPPPVNKKKIAEETTFEIEQKWARYSNPQVAEQHVSREINEAAGIADAAGNEKPIPKPDPIMFAKPTAAECAK